MKADLFPIDPNGPRKYCQCTPSPGWTGNPDYMVHPEFVGTWVCAHCGYPSYWGWLAWKKAHRDPNQPRKRVLRRRKKA